ncbi:probable serine/threonine-protein kinase samkC isoform X1 [Eurosta solidaginis]|uniref:probable serine/threonine-protein kinase samkC isoform X1 n=1 Tax=Eurosta solidaginis TaxID=178769 RepID=UPI0035316D74
MEKISESKEYTTTRTTYFRSNILPNWIAGKPQNNSSDMGHNNNSIYRNNNDFKRNNNNTTNSQTISAFNHKSCVRNRHIGVIAPTTQSNSAANRQTAAAVNKLKQQMRTMLNDCHLYMAVERCSLFIAILLLMFECALSVEIADLFDSTTPMQPTLNSSSLALLAHSNLTTQTAIGINMNWQKLDATNKSNNNWSNSSYNNNNKNNSSTRINGSDSIFMRFAKRFSAGNELWDDIIRDCYQRPTFSCFQKNVFSYLNGALDVNDVNITQRVKFYRNQVDFTNLQHEPTEATAAKDSVDDLWVERKDKHLLSNEIPFEEEGRSATANDAAETPIEEVTNALYDKSVKFAMTHDLEVKLPDVMFDGATFRISPRSFEGNGIIAKLELIPKQEVEARLAGKVIIKKIQKFLRSKLLLSFLALLLIIKIIKIKLFWLLPFIIGVGAAKKLLLKFLLFLFPALSHLFKLCSYYQQTYHSTKYHHHHHLINHHHTVVPAWHAPDHHSIPEIIYTHPPKGHPSTYLHGAPIHETYGPSFEHNEGNWENSGPGLGSDYIGDINRAAQVDENSSLFKPNPEKDANEILIWGLGTTQPTNSQQQHMKQPQRYRPVTPQQQHQTPTQQQRPPSLVQQQKLQLQQQQMLVQQKLKTQQKQQQTHNLQKPHATSQSFNPFLNGDVNSKQSAFPTKFDSPYQAQSAPKPVYAPPPSHVQQPSPEALSAAAHIVAQYDPARNSLAQQQQKQDQLKQQQLQQLLQQQKQQLSPEIAAQIKEALRIQAEQRIVSQQQQILDKQPFVQDGQPIMPKNYDPFYSPILLKIDKIIEQLGITDEHCKERVVCSMYKDPTRYSPHSNFVSAELSRDTNELQPVSNPNGAVVRFYRFIQAARDGQDQKDCLSLYSQCNINTE